VATQANPPVVIAIALVGFFAVFHGQAHGAEMPETTSGLAYGTGFILATALLHALGIAFGVLIASERRFTQLAGSAIALAGAAILAELI
jgi:urease accessory protein